jgi:hypothetical protein
VHDYGIKAGDFAQQLFTQIRIGRVVQAQVDVRVCRCVLVERCLSVRFSPQVLDTPVCGRLKDFDRVPQRAKLARQPAQKMRIAVVPVRTQRVQKNGDAKWQE